MYAALLGFGAMGMPASAQDADDGASSAICTFHGEGCDAAPSDWVWQRLEPRIGVYSVELPCDEQQANAFGQLLAMSRAPFVAGSTRACMKAAADFTVSLIGFADLPDDATRPPEVDELLQGAPDAFSAIVKRVSGEVEVPETSLNGRRAIVHTVERGDGYSRVAIVEISQFGVLMVNAGIRSGLDVTRAEGDAMIDRFFESLVFAE